MKEFEILPQEAEAYYLRFKKNGAYDCFGWGVCVLTRDCISFFGDYGSYQLRHISPSDIDSLKSWIAGTVNNFSYVMSKVEHDESFKTLVDAKTLEENFRQYLKDYEIVLTPKQSAEAERCINLYALEPSEQNAYELFSIVTDDAYEMSDYWLDWNASVKAFFNEQYRAFGEYFKRSHEKEGTGRAGQRPAPKDNGMDICL